MTLRKLRPILIRLAAVAGIVVLVMLGWGVAVEPRLILDERSFEVVRPDLPSALDGARVAVIADFQIGMWLANRAMVRRTVQKVVELRPDARTGNRRRPGASQSGPAGGDRSKWCWTLVVHPRHRRARA